MPAAALALRRCSRSRVAQAPAAPGDPNKGAQKVRCARAATASTAGARRSPRSISVPKIAGQHPAVPRRARCKDYKSGARSASVDEGDRRVALRRGHGGHRRVLRATPGPRRPNDEPRKLLRHQPCARRRACAFAGADRAAGATWRPARRRSRKCVRPATASTATARLRPTIPKLAGQYPDYLAKALRDYKSGARKNPIMAGDGARPDRARTSRTSRSTSTCSRAISRAGTDSKRLVPCRP